MSNQASVIREGALAGLGIALLPAFIVAEDVRSGRLQRLLDGFEPKPDWLCAHYPDGRVLSPKSRLFTDFLVERLRRDGG
jgi:DNA-binding transcriptional LysR family regulator